MFVSLEAAPLSINPSKDFLLDTVELALAHNGAPIGRMYVY
jgi:hypothetical protein